ncbi:MAG: amidohydrolase [Actinobacteria bacterium]|nr:amidohydrolase [Actinomycetota bacterium]MBU1943283.1 amidohydrolase [Actinomycetota bacterium]MBU2688968.1 amidohydrolase [Actinomycetota bacterium]
MVKPGSPSLFKPRFRRDGPENADMVVLSARIVTSDRDNPRAEALAVKGGRFTYVGDNRGAGEHIGPDTDVINARRKTVTPGFVDNHCHVLWVGASTSLSTTTLYECESYDELSRAVVEYAAANPDMLLVSGAGWRYDYIPGRIPNREMLDEILADRPVILMSIGGQCGWLNTAALDLLLERNPLALERLAPARDEKTGEYTGVLNRYHAMNVFDYFTLEELGPGVEEGMYSGMTDAVQSALSVGVTTMNDVQVYRPLMPLILGFRERGGLDHARVRCSFYVGGHALEDEESLVKDLEWWRDLGASESDPHLILGDSLKFYIDGVFCNHTSFMAEPYSDTEAEHGDPVWTREGFDRVIELIDGMGFQACTHAVGDAGIHRVVNSYGRAVRLNGARDARHRCDHCELPLPEDRKVMAEFEIYAAMQPAHFYADETTAQVLGHERLQRFMPWRSLEKAGVTVSFGSDWCAGPINPLYGLLIAALRINYEGKTDWGRQESVGLEDGIMHWTIDSAKALRMEKEVGSIEVGKHADFVVFNRNPLKMDSWLFLLTTELELGAFDDFVDMTVVGGDVAYGKADASMRVDSPANTGGVFSVHCSQV